MGRGEWLEVLEKGGGVESRRCGVEVWVVSRGVLAAVVAVTAARRVRRGGGVRAVGLAPFAVFAMSFFLVGGAGRGGVEFWVWCT